MSVPWVDKRGITHAWAKDSQDLNSWHRDNHHAGWYTVRATCGVSRRLRNGQDYQHRPRDREVDCMACIATEAS